jgi:hypothetical protein
MEFKMSQATVKQIQKLIDSLENTSDLAIIGRILKARHNTVQCLAGMAFRKGQAVMFTSKSGMVVRGTVAKINAKSIDVNSPLGKWRVSPSMLKAS